MAQISDVIVDWRSGLAKICSPGQSANLLARQEYLSASLSLP